MKRAAFATLFATGLVAVFSCEAIVTSDAPPFDCSGSSLAACPPGQYCKGAGCTACLPRGQDPCDGLDNDCNGKVDDGDLSDHDKDTYSYCGRVVTDDAGLPHLTDVDCDDSDPNVHPNADEKCNGKDNNCDGYIDGSNDGDSANCPVNTVCKPKVPACVPVDTCTPANCKSPSYCDSNTGQCITPTTAGIGDPCKGDAECKMGFCAFSGSIGGLATTTQGVCTATCCTSADCDAYGVGMFVCYSPGEGGRYCVKPAAVAVGGLGTAAAGETVTRATECRSGQIKNGRCVDTCCSDANCSAGTSCVANDTMPLSYQCLPSGSGAPGDSCKASTDCHSGICAGSGTSGNCYPPCCGSAACGGNVGGDSFCLDVQDPSNDTVEACVFEAFTYGGSGNVGQTCSKASDCRSYDCAAFSGHPKTCTDVCCMDRDCPSPMVCRPTSVNNTFALRCAFP